MVPVIHLRFQSWLMNDLEMPKDAVDKAKRE